MNKQQTPLQRAASILSNDWQAGKVEPVTDATERDWLESRERCYRLADANDARAARQAAIETARMAAHQVPQRAKVKRMKKGQGMDSIFGQAA